MPQRTRAFTPASALMGPDAVLSAAAQFLSAEAAAQRLGVSRATLYAYVSRGFLTAIPHPQDVHASRYSSFEIDLLVRRKGRRKGVEQAMAAINEGRPILDTALACIHEGQPIYRGLSALALAKTASVEDASALYGTASGLIASSSSRSFWNEKALSCGWGRGTVDRMPLRLVRASRAYSSGKRRFQPNRHQP